MCCYRILALNCCFKTPIGGLFHRVVQRHIWSFPDSGSEKVWKLVNIWWSYKAYKMCQIFWATLQTYNAKGNWPAHVTVMFSMQLGVDKFYRWWWRRWFGRCLNSFDIDDNEYAASSLTILVGAHELNRTEKSQRRHRVQRIVQHYKYNHSSSEDNSFDIMLLQLDSRIEFNRFSSPVCVDKTEFPTGKDCVVTGWGSTTIVGQLEYTTPNTHFRTITSFSSG